MNGFHRTQQFCIVSGHANAHKVSVGHDLLPLV